MTPTSTSHRGEKDKNAFTAKDRVYHAFLANHDVTPEEAYRQAGLVEHSLKSVENWLRGARRLWAARIDRDDYSQVPDATLEMWQNALHHSKAGKQS
jgi:hypothetical protein